MFRQFNVMVAVCATVSIAVSSPARARDETIKIAYNDPFSGPFAADADEYLKFFQFIVKRKNAEGGVLGKKLEIVPFDDKLQPAEALTNLKSIADQGIHYMMSCVGSNIQAALIKGVQTHNTRNPDQRVVYFNCGGMANELTNDQCDFWHFRFTANTEMRANAAARTLPKNVTKVYLINQDYLFGQSYVRDYKAALAKLRPDVEVVGEEFIPFGKVQDFAPYVAKIKASGAQSVNTGNFGRDLNLLIKAAAEAGLKVRFDTLFANMRGGPTAIGSAGEDRVSAVADFHNNIDNAAAGRLAEDWAKEHETDFWGLNFITMIEMLSRAMEKAGTTDPTKVALALEGMEIKDFLNQDAIIRKADHQLIMPLHAAIFSKNVKYHAEKTGLGWKPEATIKGDELTFPTTCQMNRPK